MAKRYHSSKRMDYQENYAGEYARRTQEMQDAGMIHMDRSSIANLPQQEMVKPYPKPGMYMPEKLDDTISGIDHQMSMDDKKRKAHEQPEKY